MIRPTFLYYISPHCFLDSSFDWDDFSFEQWSDEEYEWRQDDWNGLKDTVKKPKVVLEEYGDCDDYTVVVLSNLVETTDHELYLIALYRAWPFAAHMVVYDETSEIVYSSGRIRDETFAKYKAGSKYSFHLSRKVQ